MKHRKQRPDEKTIRLALLKISELGSGIKPEIVDWANIGRHAVVIAKEALREKCIECGK